MQNCAAYGSIIPVSGCCPWLHGGSSESMALREGGMIIEAWPSAPAASAAIKVSRMARAEALLAITHAIDAITRRELCTMASLPALSVGTRQ